MNSFKRPLLIAIFVFVSSFIYAQPSDPQTDPDNPVPITGLEFLLVGGGVLGGIKLYKKAKGFVSKTDK